MPDLSNILSTLGTYAGGAAGNYLLPGFGGTIGAAAGGMGGNALGGYLQGNQQQQQNSNPGMTNSEFGPARNYLTQQLMMENRGPNFNDIQQDQMRQFNEQIIPQLSERFAGNRHSGAFQQALSTAGGDLTTRLNALRYQHENQREQLNQNRLGTLSQFLTGQGQQNIQQQQANSWAPTLQTAGNLALGLGGLGAGLYSNSQNRAFQTEEANRNRDFTAAEAGRDRSVMQDLQRLLSGIRDASQAPQQTQDITYGRTN